MFTSKRKTSLRLWPYLLITVLIILVYLPTFSGEFILDDRPLIENNSYVRKFHPVVSYLFQEDGITENSDTGDYHTGYYRPLINLTYSIDYKLWGLSAPGFRTTNLLLHLCCCFLIFHFLQFLIKDRYVSLWVTLIFALHPVNTEAVSWIVSRNNILVTMFSITSLFFYIKGWEGGRRLNRVASVLTFALAILSKEMGLMVLVLFFLYQRLLSRTRRNVREELFSYIPFIIVTLCYFFLRKAVTTSYSSPFQMVDLLKSVCFAPYVILWNLMLIFLPHGLHNFVVDYPSTYLNWQFLTGFCYAGFLGIFIWKQRKSNLMIFSLLSFHIALFPILNIVPISANSLVSMRWLYFPMAFLMLSFALIIKGFLKINRSVARCVLCSVLVYLGGYSYILSSSLWNNEDNLFRQEVLNFGNYYYAGGLAENLLEKKEYRDAEGYFQIAIKRYPLNAKNYLNYSALLIDTDRPDVALLYLKEAKILSMTSKRRGQWFNNMGVAHYWLGNYNESSKKFLKAVTYCPLNIEYRANLGGAYTASGDYTKACSVLEKALEIATDSFSVRKNLALTYIHMKSPRDAIRVLQKIPRKEREKHGLQEVLEKAQRDFLRSDGGFKRGAVVGSTLCLKNRKICAINNVFKTFFNSVL